MEKFIYAPTTHGNYAMEEMKERAQRKYEEAKEQAREKMIEALKQ